MLPLSGTDGRAARVGRRAGELLRREAAKPRAPCRTVRHPRTGSPVAPARPAGHTAGVKRKWQIVGKAVGLFGLVLVAAYLGRPYPPGSGIHWSNLDRIDD